MISRREVGTKAIRFSIMEEGKEIARAWLALIPNDLHPKPYGLLEDVFVEEKYRGKGYATRLVKEVIARAKELGCHKLIATVRTEKVKVKALYMSLGFEIQGDALRMNFKQRH